MITFVLLISRHGKTRLNKYFVNFSIKDRHAIQKEISSMVIGRSSRLTHFLEWRDYIVDFKRYGRGNRYGRQWHAIPPPPPLASGDYPYSGFITQVVDVVRSAGVLEESLRQQWYLDWRVAFDTQNSLYYFYKFGSDDKQCQWLQPVGDEQLMNLQVVLRDPATISACR